ALTFRAFLEDGETVEETYYSVGGGFIQKEGEEMAPDNLVEVPYPIGSGVDVLRYCDEQDLPISEIVYANELAMHSADYVKERVHKIWHTMAMCAFHGCHKDGILPGGLNVQRRAKKLNAKYLNGQTSADLDAWLALIRSSEQDFTRINRWVSCFALAINEENASLSRVVTSPTNGAAGVIPAVLLYNYCFGTQHKPEDVERFMLTAGLIGSLFKQGATISAAQGGCQAEIGVSSAMAAAGLTEIQGGTPRQVLMAAEIAMEHHLGLTCDPVGGLVQVPCIERNAMGAIKAITASNLALDSDPEHAIVHLDTVIKTMWNTAQDMHHHYKETAEGGLAIHIPVVVPEC
ncbi:MAG: L-serine ammonia-lyase, partial [Bacteroidota bacterium]